MAPATAADAAVRQCGHTLHANSYATGGVGGIAWSLIPLQYLPPGLKPDHGRSAQRDADSTGIYFFTVKVQDSTGAYYTRQYSVAIYPPGVTPPLGLNIGPTLGPSLIGVNTFQMTASGGHAAVSLLLCAGRDGGAGHASA